MIALDITNIETMSAARLLRTRMQDQNIMSDVMLHNGGIRLTMTASEAMHLLALLDEGVGRRRGRTGRHG